MQKYIDKFLKKNLLLQNVVAQSMFWWRGSSLFNWTTNSFPRGDDYEIVKIQWQNFKIFFYRTTGQILTKLGTKYSWVKGIQVCSNEGPRPIPRGDNSKKYEMLLKIFFQKSSPKSLNWPISTKLGTNHPLVEGI